MIDRVKVDLLPANDAGACSFCRDQDADANGRRPPDALVYVIEPAEKDGPSVRMCEPCLLDAFRKTSTRSRNGAPPERLALTAWPLRAPGDDGIVRHAVMIAIYPPAELRDAPREVVEAFIQTRKKGLLAGIASEIYRGYTSEPADASAARNVAEALIRHADAQRKG